MTVITSSANSQIKAWRKLQQRRHREKSAQFFIEGVHLVEEALAHQWQVETLILADSFDQTQLPVSLQGRKISSVVISDSLFQSLSQTASPQGVAAILTMKTMAIDYSGNLLLLDRIQDPGNLGTIIRTADAAGFSGIILGDGTVDLYNDKVIRATQGSLFHLPIVQHPLTTIIPTLKEAGYSIWASALTPNATHFHTQPLPKKIALIMGNEGEGIAHQLIEMADEAVKIPLLGEAESLNVGIATAILSYHIALNQSKNGE